MKNRELFNNDPLSFTIPNDGVTTISNPKNANEWEIVKYELRSFVCEGEYQKGLERILSTFLANLDQPKQPAVWSADSTGAENRISCACLSISGGMWNSQMESGHAAW